MPSACTRTSSLSTVALLYQILVCFLPVYTYSKSFRHLEKTVSLHDKLLRSQEASPAFSGLKKASFKPKEGEDKASPTFNRDGKLTFPTNIRPLKDPTVDTAVPHFPTTDLPVFPPEEGPASLR